MMKKLNLITLLILFFSTTIVFGQEPKKVEEKNKVEKKEVQKKEEIQVTEIKRSEFEKLPIERQKIILEAPDYKVVEDKKNKK